MPNKAAAGAGTIRKKTVTRNGKQYTFWEGRITTGKDGNGKQLRRSFSGKTQKEVREKMQAAAVEITDGTYLAPSKMTVAEWLDAWSGEYLNSVKPRTAEAYKKNIRVLSHQRRAVVHRVGGAAPTVGAAVEEHHHGSVLFSQALFQAVFAAPDIQIEAVLTLRIIGCSLRITLSLYTCLPEVIRLIYPVIFLRQEGRLRWFAYALGGGVCRGHV